ncbi:MAG: CDP-alcohol phosphatidyltransferase family protein [Gemmatimonadota bacterium]|nr:CDP-alcohol phosphatidyltransferase family protein [Gemmatimonadota bacterium]
MNLPNALSLGRILVAPLIALMPFASRWELRALGFVFFVLAGVTDYFDGALARGRNQITDLGKLLDPLADKLLLLATLVPIYLLMAPSALRLPLAFLTPWGRFGLPLWVLIAVLGRELVMTVFRQAAARRGVVIAAIGPAKLKTVLQNIWVGAAYFWFAASAAADSSGAGGTEIWRRFAFFNGIVGVVTMWAAVALTVYSLGLYVRRYGYVLTPGRA